VDAKVTWERDVQFTGVSDSGFPVRMDSHSSAETGVGPVELTLMALAACTAMDVISILHKKRQKVLKFHVQAHAERADHYPKVITKAVLEYVVSGQRIEESSLVRAIELSITQYCPVHAMLAKAFPVELRYSILEGDGEGESRIVTEGTFVPSAAHTASA
jgi:putative redox protein